MRASIQDCCLIVGVVAGKPESIDERIGVNVVGVQDMHHPLMEKDPELSMYIPNVISNLDPVMSE